MHELFQKILLDCLNFAVVQNKSAISTFIEGIERENFCSHYDIEWKDGKIIGIEKLVESLPLTVQCFSKSSQTLPFQSSNEKTPIQTSTKLPYREFMADYFLTLICATSLEYKLPETLEFMDGPCFKKISCAFKMLTLLYHLQLKNVALPSVEKVNCLLESIERDIGTILNRGESKDHNIKEEEFRFIYEELITCINDAHIPPIDGSHHITEFLSIKSSLEKDLSEKIKKYDPNGFDADKVTDNTFEDIFYEFCANFLAMKSHHMNVFHPVYYAIYKST
ncbi:unnamed protein product [Gordionus sp. m RMFG-2023]